MRRYNANDSIGLNFTSKAMFLFLMISMVLLPFVAEKKQKSNENNVDPPSQGVLRAEAFWPDALDVDVDLWVKGPVGVAVGYSNLGGPLWNLLRDDLGTAADSSGRNMEIAFTRGLWDGEYIINVHLYNLKSGKLPVPIRVVLSFKESMSAPTQELFFSDVRLAVPAQEFTVFRFMVLKGKVVKESLNNLQIKIRPYDGKAVTP